MPQLIVWCDPSDLIVWKYHGQKDKYGGKLALFTRFGTFFLTKAKQDKMKCLF